MRKATPLSHVRGAIVFIAMVINTLCHAALIYALTLLRVLVPFEGFKRVIRRWLAALAESWIGVNSVVIGALARIRWDVA
ncbi:MAG: hypothetical protein AAGE01_10965, partial [Pseudomonadota bacterium]